MPKKIRYAYCKVCKQEIEEPSRQPMTTMQKVIWVLVSIGTVGIGLIAWAIYLSGRPKDHCPVCFTKLEYSDEPFVKPEKKLEEMTPKERVLEKAGIEEEPEEKEPVKKKPAKKKPVKKKPEQEKEEEKIFCPYCGEELEEKVATCPFCQSALKW